MLDEILEYLGWWKYPTLGRFVKSIETGSFEISDGVIASVSIADKQYFRIVGSLYNDGVHRADDSLDNEKFDGQVWLLAIPQSLLLLVEEIRDWQAKSGTPSPFQSESFGGYSYSRASSASGGQVTWRSAFRDRLIPYKKV